MTIRPIVIASLAFLAFAGCGERARYIETGSTEGIVSPGEVDMQDILKATSGMLESLAETGILKTGKNRPAQLVVNDVVTTVAWPPFTSCSRMR